jgi:16S rRNA U1498 N3-methylase RsmE
MQKDMHHMWEVIRLAAPAFLRFMDQVDEMKRACTVIAQERGLIALDLESCRF